MVFVLRWRALSMCGYRWGFTITIAVHTLSFVDVRLIAYNKNPDNNMLHVQGPEVGQHRGAGAGGVSPHL
jgi:hypothetical protein